MGENEMKCTNKDCPCGLYDIKISGNCNWYSKSGLHNFDNCKSYKPEEKKKRTITVSELIERGARFVHTTDAILPIGFCLLLNRIYFNESWSYISTLKSDGYKWSTDAIHLQSFEVEE